MKEEMTIEEVDYALRLMKSYKEQHPKANITLCLKTRRVMISYSLPHDIFMVEKIVYTDKDGRKV